MMHDKETVAKLLPEPPDGTMLVVYNGAAERTVIWRDDAEARRCGTWHVEERWFDNDSDPMALYQHVKYARAVYAVGEPVAVFGG